MDEIDDPLYGNTDPKGAESLAAVRAAAMLIADSCEVRRAPLGFAVYLRMRIAEYDYVPRG